MIGNTNQGYIGGKKLGEVRSIRNAFLVINVDSGKITALGSMDELDGERESHAINLCGKTITPQFNDCHTHLGFAGDRIDEKTGKYCEGKSYAAPTGTVSGIMASALPTRKASTTELIELALQRMDHLYMEGTGHLEAKTGYGLDFESEIKLAHVYQQIRHALKIAKITFLGAHAVPSEFVNGGVKDYEGYSRVVLQTLDELVKQRLIHRIDVFCDPVGFPVEHTEKIMRAGFEHGLEGTMHIEQTEYIGGIELAARLAKEYPRLLRSVSHLEHSLPRGSDAMHALVEAGVVFEQLPFVSISSPPYERPDTRQIIDEFNGSVAIATNLNPGTGDGRSQKLAGELAWCHFRMSPEEVLSALTAVPARLLGIDKETGTLEAGKDASFLIHNVPELKYVFSTLGSSTIEQIFDRGKVRFMQSVPRFVE